MAEIRLSEADGDLPDICMCCGAPSTNVVTRYMSWYPPWIIMLLAVPAAYVILWLILRKRYIVCVPFCSKHRRHWANRVLLRFATFGVFVPICVCAFVYSWPTNDGAAGLRKFAGLLGACIISTVLGVIWLTVVVWTKRTAIRPTEITDRDITLTCVAQSFVDAVEESRPSGYFAYDDEVRPLMLRANFEDGDERPRAKKKRPPSDSFEED